MRTVIVFNHPYEESYFNAILNAVTKGLQKANHGVDLVPLDNSRGFGLVTLLSNLKSVTIISTMNKPRIM